MSALRNEISEDYDHDVTPIHDDSDLDKDIVELDNVETQLSQLYECERAVRNFGMNRTALQIMCSAGLMSTTALGSMGLESMNDNTMSAKDSQIATEALGEMVKQKAAEWAAKVIAFFSKAIKKVTELVGSLWTKISDSAKVLGEKTWDGAVAAKNYVKAHPYKTILMVLAAAAVVVGIVGFVTGSAPGVGCTRAALASFMNKIRTMASGIKLPFGKVVTDTVGDGDIVQMALKNMGPNVPVEGSLGVLGWTKASFEAITKQSKHLWESFGTVIKPIWEKYIKPVERVVSAVGFFPKVAADKVKGLTGSRVLTWGTETVIGSVYYPILMRVLTNVFAMIKAIVIKAFTMVKDTFTALKSAVA